MDNTLRVITMLPDGILSGLTPLRLRKDCVLFLLPQKGFGRISRSYWFISTSRERSISDLEEQAKGQDESCLAVGAVTFITVGCDSASLVQKDGSERNRTCVTLCQEAGTRRALWSYVQVASAEELSDRSPALARMHRAA